MAPALHPAVAALDFAKAGAIIANMIESYLAAGVPPSDPEGPDDNDIEDQRPTPVAGSLHLHSPVDAGTSSLQPGEHGAPVQSEEQGRATRLEPGANPDPRPGSGPVRGADDPSRGLRPWSAMWRWARSVRSSPWRRRAWRAPIRTGTDCWSCAPS